MKSSLERSNLIDFTWRNRQYRRHACQWQLLDGTAGSKLRNTGGDSASWMYSDREIWFIRPRPDWRTAVYHLQDEVKYTNRLILSAVSGMLPVINPPCTYVKPCLQSIGLRNDMGKEPWADVFINQGFERNTAFIIQRRCHRPTMEDPGYQLRHFHRWILLP